MVPTPHQSPLLVLWDILEGLAWPPTGRVGPMCIVEALADMGVPNPPFTGEALVWREAGVVYRRFYLRKHGGQPLGERSLEAELKSGLASSPSPEPKF